jgi:hypothetical protein
VFRLLAFIDALLEAGRHVVEGAREQADFARLFTQAGPAAQVTGAKPLNRGRQATHVSQDKPFTAKPGRSQREQPDGKARPGQSGEIKEQQRGCDGQENRPYKPYPQAGKTWWVQFVQRAAE